MYLQLDQNGHLLPTLLLQQWLRLLWSRPPNVDNPKAMHPPKTPDRSTVTHVAGLRVAPGRRMCWGSFGEHITCHGKPTIRRLTRPTALFLGCRTRWVRLPGRYLRRRHDAVEFRCLLPETTVSLFMNFVSLDVLIHICQAKPEGILYLQWSR